jgi:GNAT superfamily N-acetyltransferase
LNINVRPFVPGDYPAAANIQNAQNEPHFQTTAEAMRRRDERLDPASDRVFARLTAEVDSEIVGTGYYTHLHDDYAPDKFWVGFHVRSNHQNQGVDTTMYDYMLVALSPYQPRSFWTCIREDFAAMAGYLTERDFAERFRSWGANLELKAFEPMKFADLEARLLEQGIELRILSELATDAERDRRLLELHAELEEEAPHFDPIIPKHHPDLRNPRVLHEGYCVAVHEGDYIGMASLILAKSQTTLGCGLTGVRRGYRNRGVATALKARAAAWAKAHGYAELNAGGAGANAAMLTVNRRLGFEIEPTWITYANTP